MATIRDYSDIISEVVKLLQDPFSFRLMEISAKCNKSFQRENLTKTEKQELAEMFDNFLKQTIYPLSKALDTFLPIIKDTAVMARESARACTLFSQWSREFGDAIIREGLTWEVMIYKAEELNTRFRENGIPKHWLPPSIVPLFKTIVEQFKRQIPRHYSMATDTSRSDPAAGGAPISQELRDEAALAILKTEVEEKSAELRKSKNKVVELRQLIDQLHNEKEDLIRQLSDLEENKLDLGKSGLRNRRSAGNSDTPVPPVIVPRIELQESQDEPEHIRGSTPEELPQLIEKHEEEASPPSEVSEENTLDEFERLEDEAGAHNHDEEISEGQEADDETSVTTPRIDDDGKKHGIEEELVEAESVIGEDYHNDEVEPEEVQEGNGDISQGENNNDEGSIKDADEVEGTPRGSQNDAESEHQRTARSVVEGEAPFEAGLDTIRSGASEPSKSEGAENQHEDAHIFTIGSIDNPDVNEVEEPRLEGDNQEKDGKAENPETPKSQKTIEEEPSEDPGNNQHEKTIIEFWHLAKALASLLSLKVPEEEEIIDEHERRKTTLDNILAEMEKLLIHIKDKQTQNN